MTSETPKPWTADPKVIEARTALIDAMIATPRNSDTVGAIGFAVDALEAAVASSCVAAGAEDTRRLDWLEARHAQLIPCQTDDATWDGWNVWDDVTHTDLGDGDTIRTAIGAARQGEGTK